MCREGEKSKSFSTLISTFLIASRPGRLKNGTTSRAMFTFDPPTRRLSDEIARASGNCERGRLGHCTRHPRIAFAREGCKVMAVDRDPEGLREAVDEIRKAGGGGGVLQRGCFKIGGGAGRRSGPPLERFGDLHILFNGAGILAYGTVLETPEDVWQRVMAVNLTGTFLFCKAVLPHMVEKGRGAIVNVASTTGAPRRVRPRRCLCKFQRRSYAADPVHGNRLRPAGNPGQCNLSWTNRHAHVAQGINAGTNSAPLLSPIPWDGWGKPEELAKAAVFLASDDASFVTGTLLYVDGGANCGSLSRGGFS